MGKITTISGPMYAGKTTRLIELFRREQNKSKVIIKPKIDTRYSAEHVVSHNKEMIAAECIDSVEEFLQKTEKIKYLFIDELQFFSIEIAKALCDMASHGKQIFASGLNLDFRGNPFETVKFMIEHSDVVEMLQGECEKCNNASFYTFRISRSDELILIGEKEDYQALCSVCFDKYRKINDQAII